MNMNAFETYEAISPRNINSVALLIMKNIVNERWQVRLFVVNNSGCYVSSNELRRAKNHDDAWNIAGKWAEEFDA